MPYFLARPTPKTYSIDDLEREGKTTWDGVRNPAAVRAIHEMRPPLRGRLSASSPPAGEVFTAPAHPKRFPFNT
jgi:predicted RNA-binding protein with PUA-like domain